MCQMRKDFIRTRIPTFDFHFGPDSKPNRMINFIIHKKIFYENVVIIGHLMHVSADYNSLVLNDSRINQRLTINGNHLKRNTKSPKQL